MDGIEEEDPFWLAFISFAIMQAWLDIFKKKKSQRVCL
jgi:hypothetical protein